MANVWVVGDIHGMYDKFMEFLNHSDVKPEDKIILIGDIIDRGNKVYPMLTWAIENIQSSYGRFEMILGNHEDMLISEYENLRSNYNKNKKKKEIFAQYDDFSKLPISFLNCHYDFDVDMKREGFSTVGSIAHFVEWMKRLPLFKNVQLVDDNGDLKTYIITHAWYDKDNRDRETLLWERDIRDYIDNYQNPNFFKPDYNPIADEILIHGHTPTLKANGYPTDKHNGNLAEVNFREHSINIDCGACFGKYHGRLAVINLKNQNVLYF